MSTNLTVDPVEKAEAELLKFPQVECPVTELFAPGVYSREIFMPAGAMVIGHRHKTEHLNIVLSGKARVMMDGVVHDIVAPQTFVSGVGVRKVLFIIEDMRWMTIHPTHETDPEKLRAELIEPSESFRLHQEQIKQLKGE